MELNLAGRKVAITGGSDGIGRSMAIAFASEGARVAVCARSEERLSSLSLELGGGHVFQQADLTKKEGLERT